MIKAAAGMPGKIFVNYRRDDGAANARNVHDRLARAFGPANVFMDVDNLLAGQRFDKELAKALGHCDVFVSIIGPRWLELLTTRQSSGDRDYVHEEIAAALARSILVIPVLIDRAALPRAEALPEDIRALVLHQKQDVAHEHFSRDIDDLVRAIRQGRRAMRAETRPAAFPLRPIAAGAAAVALIAAALVMAPMAGIPLPFQFPFPLPWAKTTAAPPPAKPQAEEPAPRTARETPAENNPASLDPLARLQAAIAAATGRDQLLALMRDNPSARAAIEARLGALGYVRVAASRDGKPSDYWLKPGDGEVFWDCAACPGMVVVPQGAFTMGSPDNESGRNANEGPQHRVTLAAPFAVGKLDTTVDQFSAFVQETGYDAGAKCFVETGGKFVETSGRSWRDPGFPQTGSHPAVCLNFVDAKAYADWLSRKSGKSYRLLTEAEWEHATRAGSTTKYFFGDDEQDFCKYGNGADLSAKKNNPDWNVVPCDDGFAFTAPVGHFMPNAYGLNDMLGNAWQWVEDCYHDNYDGAPTDGSAAASGDCSRRVARGGSWSNSPGQLRSARRIGYRSVSRVYNFTIRVARSLQ